MNEDGETRGVFKQTGSFRRECYQRDSILEAGSKRSRIPTVHIYIVEIICRVSENKAKHKILHSLVTEIYVQPAKRTPRDKT